MEQGYFVVLIIFYTFDAKYKLIIYYLMKKAYLSPSVEALFVGHGTSILETLSSSAYFDDYGFEGYLEDWVDAEETPN